MIKELLEYDKEKLVDTLWRNDPKIFKILRSNNFLENGRNDLFNYLNNIESHLYDIYSDKYKHMNLLEKNNAKECIRVFKNVIRTKNERIAKFSAFNILYHLAHEEINFDNNDNKINDNQITEGFLFEFIFLFKGINGESELYLKNSYNDEYGHQNFFRLKGVEAALERTRILDNYASDMETCLKRYKTGLDNDLMEERERNKKIILDRLGGDELDWQDYRWHLENIISDVEDLKKIVKLDYKELNGLRFAKKHRIPFQITPYYLSLFNLNRKNNRNDYDRGIRAQVIPTVTYCNNVIKSKEEGTDLDFMDEKSTSPVKGITRRYPQILILKPFKACSQICVYCQRNWEITDIKDSKFSYEEMKNAIKWIKDNEYITEVLITGGDPLVVNDMSLDWILHRVSNIEHVERIRIGTRIIVTLPQRMTDELVDILNKYHEIGKRDLNIVTHFEHPTEMTVDAIQAIKKLKMKGMNIYNQQVFTYYNSRKFETCLLRKILKKSGIDPYYTFNTKGKEETIDFRVPIARIEQERKEEARLLPGMVRTDEAVFNVPRLGKSSLRSWQDHEVIMILGDGRRVYRFYPWESGYGISDPYNYIDVSIYEYLKRLDADKEDVDQYSTIFYYF